MKIYGYNKGIDYLLNLNEDYIDYDSYLRNVNNYDIYDLWVYSKNYMIFIYNGYREAYQDWISYKNNQLPFLRKKDAFVPWKITI